MTLAFQDANSKLLMLLVLLMLMLRNALTTSWTRFWSWSRFLVKTLRLRFGQDLKLMFGCLVVTIIRYGASISSELCEFIGFFSWGFLSVALHCIELPRMAAFFKCSRMFSFIAYLLLWPTFELPHCFSLFLRENSPFLPASRNFSKLHLNCNFGINWQEDYRN